MNSNIRLGWLRKSWVIPALKLCAYLALFVLLLRMSWGAWPDITVDFGRELYIPWRLLHGDLVYNNIDYYYGAPISIYWNAFWFLIFGTSLNVLIAVNIVLLVTLVFLLEYWLTEVSDKFSAFFCVSFFLSVFAFGRYVGIGNYNYITPYSHALVQGVILILLVLVTLRKWEKTGKIMWLGFAGVAFGIALINKFEVSITCIVTVVVYLGAILYIRPRVASRSDMALFSVATIAPAVLVTVILSAFMPFGMVIRGIFDQWIMLFDGRISRINDLLFYKVGMGTNDVGGNLYQMFIWVFRYLGFTSIGLFCVFTCRKYKLWKLFHATFIVLLVCVTIYFLPTKTWFGMIRPLPIFMIAGLLFSLWQIVKCRNKSAIDAIWALRSASFAFGLIFLMKMFFNAHLYHYGFVLAMPATLLTIAVILYWLPFLIARKGYVSWPFKVFASSIIFSVAFMYMLYSQKVYSRNIFPVSANGNIIMADVIRGQVIQKTINELEERLAPDQTMVVMPEGVMLNYLVKHRNSTPFISFMPDLFIRYDEQKIIDEFAKNPPDYVVLIHSDTSEYGFHFFGKDYAINLYNWVEKNYTVVWQSTQKPFEPSTVFGVSIAKRNENRAIR